MTRQVPRTHESMKRKQGIAVSEIAGKAPLHKVKSTIVPCIDTDIVFSYGGFDDGDELDSNVYLLNLKTKRWEIDNKQEKVFREGHSATYIGNGNVFVFGGVPAEDELPHITESGTSRAPLGFSVNSLMMIYNVNDKRWSGPPKFATINAPAPRSRHACCLSPDGTKLYISGGISKSDSLPLDDLYYYDLLTGKWSEPVQFVPRFDHYITIHNDKLYSFGGIDSKMTQIRNAITYYSLTNRVIGEITNLREVNTGIVPSAYLSHQCERLYLTPDINPALTLDVRLPLLNNYCGFLEISIVDLEQFDTKTLLNMEHLMQYSKENNLNFASFTWNESFVNNGTLYLLGVKSERRRSSTADMQVPANHDIEGLEHNENHEINGMEDPHPSHMEFEEGEVYYDLYPNMKYLLEVDLFQLGVPKAGGNSQVANPLASDFERLFVDQEFTDFDIYTLASEAEKDNVPEDIDPLDSNNSLRVVKVHKSVLIARWPHFRRMMSSGMVETQSNKMFICETYHLVTALVYYLYTETINFEKLNASYSMLDFAGLLLLSNMYSLSNLRSLVMSQLYKSFQVLEESFMYDPDYTGNNKRIKDPSDLLLQLWRKLYQSDEPQIMSILLNMINKNWARITRSETFLGLAKFEIVHLCQSVSENDRSENSENPSSFHSSRESNSPFIIDDNVDPVSYQ